MFQLAMSTEVSQKLLD